MLFSMPKITYFLRSNNDLAQSYILYCRVTLNGSNAEFSTKERLKSPEWDQRAQCFVGSARKTVYFATLTETLTYKIKSAALFGDFQTARELLDSLKKQKVPVKMENLIESYVEACAVIAAGTRRNHRVKLANFRAYQDAQKKQFTPDNFGLIEAERFKAWFIKRAQTTRVDTANRHITLFKSALYFHYKKGEIKAFELMHYKGEKDKVPPVVFLTPLELEHLKKCPFKSPMLSKVRDLFLFQCYTGLSYADLWGAWEIHTTAAGAVIEGVRKKNAQAFYIPLQAEALEILNLYLGVLPQYTNEVYNRILKEIAAIAGIDKRLTTHTARKSYASLMNTRGWSRESVGAMLGHRSSRTTETYYIGRDFSRIEMEMKKRG